MSICGLYQSTHCKYIWDRLSVQRFLVQGQLIAGSGPSLVGLGAGVLADPETREVRYIASITDQELPMNGHHLDPQVTGDSHMLDLFKTVPLCMHQHLNEKRENIRLVF